MSLPSDNPLSRREVLQGLACGVGGLALSALLADEGLAAEPKAGRAPGPHHTPKAKSLIFLNMQGGPTQFETFDYKPELVKRAGQAVADARRPGAKVMPPAFKFTRAAKSGLECSEAFPHTAAVMDELCVIKSMVCDSNAHPGGQRQALTGFDRRPMPSFGSWILYGLGSANKNLPGFVYLANGFHHGSGFLPAQTQGMPVGHKVPNLKRPGTFSEAQQREQLDLLARMNKRYAAGKGEDPLDARVEAAELAFRMQMACPEAVDLGKESAATRKLYGVTGGKGRPAGKVARTLPEGPDEFGSMCLVARRLVQRGVRVVTICVGGRRGWDQHSNLKEGIAYNASVIDQGMAALIKDLKAHGLLDSTLVMWGGEFGRTPYAEGRNGRDHFNKAYTMWLAGGGAKAGVSYGKTDELGLNVVEGRVHVRDLFATVLHLMGLDHEKLTYRYAGREQRLTDVDGKVVKGLMA